MHPATGVWRTPLLHPPWVATALADSIVLLGRVAVAVEEFLDAIDRSN